jgi:hypothetical protein
MFDRRTSRNLSRKTPTKQNPNIENETNLQANKSQIEKIQTTKSEESLFGILPVLVI